MYKHNGSVYVEDDDQCNTCEHFCKGVACPLMQALGMNFIHIDQDLSVTACGFYKEFGRTLKLVKDGGE